MKLKLNQTQSSFKWTYLLVVPALLMLGGIIQSCEGNTEENRVERQETIDKEFNDVMKEVSIAYEEEDRDINRVFEKYPEMKDKLLQNFERKRLTEPSEGLSPSAAALSEINGETVFKVVEQMPRFPGCETEASEEERKSCATKNMLEFIYKNVKYPKLAREKDIEGTTVVSFIVTKEGKLEKAKLLRDIGGGCGEEALRVIRLMREQGITWVPGHQQGEAVNVRFNIPIKFRLE